MSNGLTADVVIVGSGVAGALCAYRLARRGVKVLILEAGPRIRREAIINGFQNSPQLDLSAGYPNPDWAPRPDWGKAADPYILQTGPVINRMEYLRVVGGTTWHWSGNALRLRPEDFRLASLYQAGIDWPISYDILEPDYAAAERELGVAGDDDADRGLPRSTRFPLPPVPPSHAEKWVAKRLRTAGLSFTARPSARNTLPFDGRGQCAGFGSCSPICPTGAQYSAMVHIEKAERLGVRVMENCRVDRLDTNASGKVRSLAFSRSDGSTGTARGTIFAIAANGIETPRLLLMSASAQHPHGLANSSGQVGRNFMDHLGLYVRMDLPEAVYTGRGPVTTQQCLDYCEGGFRRSHAGWLMGTDNTLDLHQLAEQELARGLWPPALDEAIRQRARHQYQINAHMEQLPAADNRITLNWALRDRAGQPQIRLHYSFGEYEQAGFARIRGVFRTIGQTLGARDTRLSEPFAHHHLMGATRMGIDPRRSVADSHGRTHDHANLFLLGSSLFPTGGTANPTLTIAALTLRITRAMLQQLRPD
ncbi:MAG: GMC family oxidoreductase [Sulfuritalea sp.]|nr:GMC family oxidoreductase [Sulfuritalea sp.]